MFSFYMYTCNHTDVLYLYPRTQVKRERSEVVVNVANFKQGKNGRRCICDVPGQVPCPKFVPIPNVHHPWHDKGTETAV